MPALTIQYTVNQMSLYYKIWVDFDFNITSNYHSTKLLLQLILK